MKTQLFIMLFLFSNIALSYTPVSCDDGYKSLNSIDQASFPSELVGSDGKLKSSITVNNIVLTANHKGAAYVQSMDLSYSAHVPTVENPHNIEIASHRVSCVLMYFVCDLLLYRQ